MKTEKSTNATTSFFSFLVAFVVPFTCPACWPLYIGFMGSLGVTVAVMQPFLTPITILLILITLTGLFRGYKLNSDSTPLILGVFGVALLLSGVYWLDYPKVTFAGVGLLIGASLWNIWPKWDLGQA